MEEGGILVGDVVEETMVGHKDDKEVVPGGGGTQAVHQLPDAMVGEGKGIELGIGQPVVGHLKGLVATECLEYREPGLSAFLGCNLLNHTLGSHGIVGSPFALLCLQEREIFVADQLAEAASHEIAFEIGEVDVTSVDIAGLIAGFHQGSGDGGQRRQFARHLHQAHRGISRPAA